MFGDSDKAYVRRGSRHAESEDRVLLARPAETQAGVECQRGCVICLRVYCHLPTTASVHMQDQFADERCANSMTL